MTLVMTLVLVRWANKDLVGVVERNRGDGDWGRGNI
jgi:hypothetical protein